MDTLVKLDWNTLKQDYKYGNIESVNAFLESKEIKINGNVTRITTGWRAERDEYRRLLDRETEDKMVKWVSDSEVEVRKRQAKVARFLQARGLEAMRKRDTKDVSEPQATRLIEIGLQEEREAIGIVNQRPLINNTVNAMSISSVMNTHFGQALQCMTYDELAETLKEMQRLEELDPTGLLKAPTVE